MSRQDTREDQARREVGQTDVSAAVARFLVTTFVLIVFGAPISHHLASRANDRDALAARAPGRPGDAAGVVHRLRDANAALMERIHRLQDRLDETFILARALRAPAQTLMLRLGVGNEEVLVGRDGWLFYEPGVRSITGPGFLAPRQLKRRSREGNELAAAPQPNPVAAIVHFRDQLKRRGVELVVVPAPAKASIHPGSLARRLQASGAALQNASYAAFLDALRSANVRLFDPAPMLIHAAATSGDQYLRTDTHWKPGAVAQVAEALAVYIQDQELVGAPHPGQPIAYGRQAARKANVGDIERMLGLPDELYAAESVSLSQVVEPDGQAWANREEADVLLLGDSFANIYSQAEMGWGDGAGLAEQLSYALQRPVERLARNDAGAYATREMLARDLARGRDRLATKRLVVWQFAARELALGDWKLIDLPQVGTARPTGSMATSRATGTIAQRSERPEKDASYKDFVMKFYVTDLRGDDGKPIGEGDGVVHIFAMRDRAFLPAAGLRLGSRISLSMRPWSDVEGRFGSLKTGSLDDIMLEIEKPLYWGELD